MRACGLVGSPIIGGNVDLLVDQTLAGAASRGATTNKILLNELSVRPCQSCGPLTSSAFCRYNDDMQRVYRELERSDIVVLGSPVYFDTVSAQVKLMIDRCNCLAPLAVGLDGEATFKRCFADPKRGIFIAVGGADQDFGPICLTATGFFSWINAELVGSVLYRHRGIAKGGVGSASRWLTKAFHVGARAASR